MMQTLWAKELFRGQQKWLANKGPSANVHVAAQELDLKRDDGLSQPNHGKNTAEHGVFLVGAGSEAEEQAEKQAENERPPQVPVPQAWAHVALQESLSVHDAAGKASQLLPRA